MKGALERDDAIAFALTDGIEIAPDDLETAFHGLGAGIGKQHGVGKAVRDQPLGQALLVGNTEQVRGMPQGRTLTDQGLDQMRMAVAQSIHRDAG